MPSLPYKAFGCLQVTDRRVFPKCGSTDHLITQCPRESRNNRSLQESGRGKSVTLPSTRDRGGPIHHRERGGTIFETMDRPIPTALA